MTAKILVVDDSMTIQKIVAMAFENEDASVEGIGDGGEAGVQRHDGFSAADIALEEARHRATTFDVVDDLADDLVL